MVVVAVQIMTWCAKLFAEDYFPKQLKTKVQKTGMGRVCEMFYYQLICIGEGMLQIGLLCLVLLDLNIC